MSIFRLKEAFEGVDPKDKNRFFAVMFLFAAFIMGWVLSDFKKSSYIKYLEDENHSFQETASYIQDMQKKNHNFLEELDQADRAILSWHKHVELMCQGVRQSCLTHARAANRIRVENGLLPKDIPENGVLDPLEYSSGLEKFLK